MSNLQRSPTSESNPDLTGLTARKRKQRSQNDLDTWLLEHNKKDKDIEDIIINSVKSVLTSELVTISDSLKNISAAVQANCDENASIKKLLNEVNNKFVDYDKSLVYSEERQNVFDNRLKSLETQATLSTETPHRVIALENKVAAMEQIARACNVEIANLPDKRGENLIAIITQIGSFIGYELTQRDILSIHRVPHADSNDKRPKNVIIKFSSRYIRDNFLAAFRMKKGVDSTQLSISGPSNKIYANEHLTLGNKLLFRECREKAKTYAYKYVWVKHGIVLMRKSDSSPILAVRSSQDILKIK